MQLRAHFSNIVVISGRINLNPEQIFNIWKLSVFGLLNSVFDSVLNFRKTFPVSLFERHIGTDKYGKSVWQQPWVITELPLYSWTWWDVWKKSTRVSELSKTESSSLRPHLEARELQRPPPFSPSSFCFVWNCLQCVQDSFCFCMFFCEVHWFKHANIENLFRV